MIHWYNRLSLVSWNISLPPFLPPLSSLHLQEDLFVILNCSYLPKLHCTVGLNASSYNCVSYKVKVIVIPANGNDIIDTSLHSSQATQKSLWLFPWLSSSHVVTLITFSEMRDRSSVEWSWVLQHKHPPPRLCLLTTWLTNQWQHSFHASRPIGDSPCEGRN